MREIKVKVLEVEIQSLINRLTRLGAEVVFDGELTDVYFDTPEKELTNKGDTLRIRSQARVLVLTYKQNLPDAEAVIKHIFETKISSFSDTKQIIEILGYKEFSRSEKLRTSFVLNSFRFNIDTYSDIPAFLEIEGNSYKEIVGVARKLSIKQEDLKPWSVKELFEHYGKI